MACGYDLLRFMPLLRVKKQRIWAAACLLRAVRMLSWAIYRLCSGAKHPKVSQKWHLRSWRLHFSPGMDPFLRHEATYIIYCIILGTTWHNTLDIANTRHLQKLPSLHVTSTSILEISAKINAESKKTNKAILMASWHILTVGCCVASKVWLLASAMAFPTLRRPLFAGLVRPTQGQWDSERQRSWICWN